MDLKFGSRLVKKAIFLIHLWKIAFCRGGGNEWLSSLNPHLLHCPVELMMVCDQYFPYIYYFYTHLLGASQLNFQIAHRHALLFLPEKH